MIIIIITVFIIFIIIIYYLKYNNYRCRNGYRMSKKTKRAYSVTIIILKYYIIIFKSMLFYYIDIIRSLLCHTMLSYCVH